MSKPTVDSPAPDSKPISDGPAAAPAVYNPLSKLAILGVGCAALYSAIVLVSAMVALRSGTPLLLGDAMFFLPLAAAGLSLLAYRQIRNSEGTLSGDHLARWGLWLSVLTGLGYGTYFLATGLAIQQQANLFLTTKGEESGFFELIQQNELNRAFLLTQPFQKRMYINPDDAEKMKLFQLARSEKEPLGPLTQFVDNDLVQVILVAGKEKKPVQPLGVKLWKYEGGEYYVERNYRIETEELALTIVVPVRSNDESTAGEARKWTVEWTKVQVVDAKPSPLGEKVHVLRQQAGNVFKKWSDILAAGALTDPLPENRSDWNNPQLWTGGEAKFKEDVEKLFAGKDKTPRKVKTSDRKFIPWEMADGHIQFNFSLQLLVPALFDPHSTAPKYFAEVLVFVRSKEKVDPHTADVSQPLEWSVVAVQVISIREVLTAVMPKAPGG